MPVPSADVAAIPGMQEARVVANDYTVRFEDRIYRLDEATPPGERDSERAGG